METQKTIIQAKPVTLSMDDQEAIITYVKECWDKGKAERKKYEDHWKQCEDAYHCVMPPIESPELDWMSNECLPWAFDASDSWYAHIHSTTIPKNDQVFTISGRTEEDHPGADMMQKYMEYRFERNDYARQLGRAEKELSIRNHACLKVYWRENTTVEYNYVDEPVIQQVPDQATGQVFQIQTGTKKKRVPQEKVTFNNVWIDVVDLNSFVFYPIKGDFEKTTRIEEIYRYYEDFIASKDKTNYFNLEQITLDDEQQDKDEKNSDKKQPKGLKIKEAWIHRVKIGDQVYRNYVATIVNDKVLVRFQPFPPGCPKSPYVWMALRRDGDCLYGYGLNSKGLGLLNAANKKFNGWIDEGILTQHGAHVYWDDGVFNPNNVVRRPGAMIKMSPDSVTQGNLRPLVDDLSKQQQAMQDLAALKVEFETVTVPKVVKGMIEVGRDATATEINQAQNNSSGKMHIDAYNINDYVIKPTLELSYQAIYDRVQMEAQGLFEPTVTQEIQIVTQPKDANGNPTGQLPILPLPEVDIKVVGYQNVIRKQEQLAALGQTVPQLVQSPAAKYLKWDNLAEDVFRLSDLDPDRLLMSEVERQQADQAEQQAQQQQQALLVQQEATKLQLQKEKQDQDFQINMLKLELEKQKIECDCQAKQQQAQQNAQDSAHNAAMDHNSAAMAGRQQDFNETQAEKLAESKGGTKNG